MDCRRTGPFPIVSMVYQLSRGMVWYWRLEVEMEFEISGVKI